MKRFAIPCVALLLCGTVRADKAIVNGRITDAAGKPVAGAELSTTWMADSEAMKPYEGVSTDTQGRFSIKLTRYGRPTAVLALDKNRKTGGLFTVDATAAVQPVNLKLQPLVRAKGKFFCKEMNFKPTWTNVYMMTTDGGRFLSCTSLQADFSFLLPPGKYRFRGYGTDVRELTRDITLAADRPLLNLGTLELEPTPIARHKGKAPPKWHVTGTRGAPKDVTLANYRGKWVLVDFFTHWCGPCVARSLPNLIDLYEDHRDHRNKFEILAFHVEFAKDLKDYDEKTKSAKRKYWKNQELPFPLLLDATKKTREAFGIRFFPTTILIDPEGKLVGEVNEEDLEKKLPPLAPSVRVPRALDRIIPLGLTDQSLQEAVAILSARSRVDLRLDEASLMSAGVAPGAKVPLRLAGSLTLRSWLNLVMAADKLSCKSDDRGIVITAKVASSAPPKVSGPQQACAKRIAERLGKKETLAFHDASFADVVEQIKELTRENVALDPAARKAGKLNPDERVTGSVNDISLGDGLQKLLEPMGLTIVVRDEVVLITAKQRR